MSAIGLGSTLRFESAEHSLHVSYIRISRHHAIIIVVGWRGCAFHRPAKGCCVNMVSRDA